MNPSTVPNEAVRARPTEMGTSTMATQRQVVSLFSGAGGLDLGLAAAGWDVRAQVEMDGDAADTLRLHAKNLAEPPLVLDERIEDVDPRDLRRSLGLRRGQLGLLAGGPPCQPFTTSGLRQALSDRRASSLFPAYFSFVDEFAPRAILIENVDGMLSAALRHRPLNRRGPGHPPLSWEEQKGSFLHWLLVELVSRGYAMAWGVVEAADYGVPQMRQRAILIGVKGRFPCFLPPATHGEPPLIPFRKLGDAFEGVTELGSIQPLSARKRAVYAMVPPGGNWRDLPVEVQQKTMGAAFVAQGGKSGWWRRLAWDLPAPTILGMPDHSSTALVHPTEIRCLSVAECAAAQSFPPGTEFAGSGRSQYQQIGNAVPPLLGEALGKRIAAFVEGERTAEPLPPPWRQASANRRIGTHGWVRPDPDGPRFKLLVRVRPDHVWASLGFGSGGRFKEVS